MSSVFGLLGWNSLQIKRGSLGDTQPWAGIDLNWQPGDIRNCSYAPQTNWIGITSEDRTQGQQVLAIYEYQNQTTRFLLRSGYILHHAFNSLGTLVCYTQPSSLRGTADLYLYELDNEHCYCLMQESIAQNSIPAWFPDHRHIAYHSPDGYIEVFDCYQGNHRRLAKGQLPSVSPTGEYIAFQNNNQIFLWHQISATVQSLRIQRPILGFTLAGNLSWSADEKFLSFGVVSGLTSKQITFYLLQLATGQCLEVQEKYLRGLLIVSP